MTSIAVHSAAHAQQIELSERRKTWDWVWALSAYLAFTLVFFWPVLFRLSSAIIGPSADGDPFYFPWNFWQFRVDLLSGHDPATTHRIFALYPQGAPLFYGGLFVSIVGAVLGSVVPPMAAYNLMVIGTFVAAGVAVYLLTGEFVVDRFARFFAGFAYTFSTFHFFRAAGHLGEMNMEMAPFCAWRAIVFVREPTLKNAVWAGVTLALVPLSDIYYGPYFALPFYALLLFWTAFRNRAWYARKRNLGLLTSVFSVAVILVCPTVLNLLSVSRSSLAEIQQVAASSTSALSADLAAFFLPVGNNPIFAPLTQDAYLRIAHGSHFPIENAVFLGFVPLLLALVGFVSGRKTIAIFWAAFGVIGTAIALGPNLHIFGRDVMPLPFYRLLFSWSLLSSFRAPNRAIEDVLLAVAVLSAIGTAALTGALARRRVAKSVTVAICSSLLLCTVVPNWVFGFPYPYSNVHVSPVYHDIALDAQSNGLMLNLPLQTDPYRQYLQTVHGKSLVDGYSVRTTPQMEASAHELPYVALFDMDPLSGINIAGARQMPAPPRVPFKRELQSRNIAYVVLYKQMDPYSLAWAERFMRQNLGAPYYEGTDGIDVWKIRR